MNRVGDDRPVSYLDTNRVEEARELEHDGDIKIPLNFLEGVSTLASKNIERRPPKIRLVDNQQAAMVPLLRSGDIGEPSQISYQVAEFIIRRIDDIEQSGDLGALRGFAAIERIVRMYEHVFISRSPVTLPEESS